MIPKWFSLYALCALWCISSPAADLFDYDRKAPLDIRRGRMDEKFQVTVHDISFANSSGGRTAAYFVSPEKRGKMAGILYVHWYSPESPDSNRTQFLKEAVELGRKGAVSLLVETMWSDPKWFRTRTQEGDYENSVKQVKDLRRALDLLLSDRDVDPKRVAYVGHDFGAMYGAVLAGVEKRISAYALLAGTPSFSDWYLYGPPIEGEAREKFIQQMAVIDPVRYVPLATPASILFQFAKTDRFVPPENAEAFFTAAKEPKKILWYEAGHGLNEEAAQDRQAWLAGILRLK